MMSLCNDYYLASSSGGINITRINTVVKQQEQRLLRSRQNMSTGAWISPAKAGRVRVRSHHSRDTLGSVISDYDLLNSKCYEQSSKPLVETAATPQWCRRRNKKTETLEETYHFYLHMGRDVEIIGSSCYSKGWGRRVGRYRSEQSSTSSSPSLQSNL